jgi:hypothetical protein
MAKLPILSIKTLALLRGAQLPISYLHNVTGTAFPWSLESKFSGCDVKKSAGQLPAPAMYSGSSLH